jgi:high affinity Mn2+ porin
MVLEAERRWKIDDHPGALRLSAFLEEGRWASYKKATELLIASPPDPNTPAGTQVTVPEAAYGYHYKYGFGLNWEQEVAKDVGLFGRLGWNNGRTAAAAYTDDVYTAQLGLSVKGAAWSRPEDTIGWCSHLDGASPLEREFLKAGGTGISIGDGTLTYSPEFHIETYYDLAVTSFFHFAVDYQFFLNPAFNRDRGPVNVFMIRLHWQF